jgi:CrcB protein
LRILLLAVSGAAGTLLRYALQGIVQYRSGPDFPTGTLTVNILGCFLLGGLGQFALQHLSIPPEWRIAMTIGFCGAFTTFSTFGWETVGMLDEGRWAAATVYVGLSVVGGILAVLAGLRLASRF